MLKTQTVIFKERLPETLFCLKIDFFLSRLENCAFFFNLLVQNLQNYLVWSHCLYLIIYIL